MPVECDELEEHFNAASNYVAAAVTSQQPGFTDNIKLQFYGLYKQATLGACDAKQPGFWNPAARAKWDAWHKLGDLPSDEAMRRYISVLSTLVPTWSGSSAAGLTLDADSSGASSGAQGQAAPSSSKRVNAGGGFGPVFSMFANVEDGVGSDETGDHQLHVLAGEGDEAKLAALLQTAGTQVDERDDEGCTALHFAADRGQMGTARMLLAAGADVNAQDNDGSSPLHYATLCGHSELAGLLLDHGADPALQDSSGNAAT